MKVKIVSLKGLIFEGESRLLNVGTLDGEITVMDHHIPLITALSSGLIKVADYNNNCQSFQVAGGFLEVSKDNKAAVLAD